MAGAREFTASGRLQTFVPRGNVQLSLVHSRIGGRSIGERPSARSGAGHSSGDDARVGFCRLNTSAIHNAEGRGLACLRRPRACILGSHPHLEQFAHDLDEAGAEPWQAELPARRPCGPSHCSPKCKGGRQRGSDGARARRPPALFRHGAASDGGLLLPGALQYHGENRRSPISPGEVAPVFQQMRTPVDLRGRPSRGARLLQGTRLPGQRSDARGSAGPRSVFARFGHASGADRLVEVGHAVSGRHVPRTGFEQRVALG